MSAAFPQRQAQREFLAYYATLKDDDDANGEELIAGHEVPSDDDESDEDLGLIDHGALRDDDVAHKQLDAARRAEEERELQALAQLFEARASDYVYDAGREEEDTSWRTAKQLRAAARQRAEAARAMEKAQRAEEEGKAKRAETAKKRKHDALGALYAAYGAIDAGQEPPTHPAFAEGAVQAGPTWPPASAPARSESEWEREGGVEASGAKKPKKQFRISKKRQ